MMADIVRISARNGDAEPTDHELLMRTLDTIAALDTRLGRVEDRLPPFALPDNWITIKAASKLCNYSTPALYRFCHLGLIDSRTVGGRVAVDSNTLARRLAAHLAKRKKIK